MGKRKEVGTWSITWRLGGDTFYMMATYPKSERDDLSTEQRRRILAALESTKSREASNISPKQSAGIWSQITPPNWKDKSNWKERT
jgi:hypothetical protein